MADESPFTIRDRRRSQEAPVPPPASPPHPPDTRPAASPLAAEPPRAADTRRNTSSPPAGFSELIFGLGASAFAALGVQSAPGEESPTGSPGTGGHSSHLAVDLDHARHFIDLLDILERKTAGNLTPDEQHLLQQLLYTLRLTFVERSHSGPVAPPGDAR
jgi:hypothetical protein